MSLKPEQLLHLGMVIANRAVISDIESECVRVELGDSRRWYDTRPMLDPREHCDDAVQMATQALSFAEDSGLVVRHAQQRHLVCIAQATPPLLPL